MSNMQLPAHLQGRVASGVAARAVEGMGSSLPPHISIRGNRFTFVDASGNEAQPMLSFDGYVVDVSDHMNKRYYEYEYDQSAQSYEPPTCWSSNGIGPSREASKPQAMTCESCSQNVRGSARSKMSGAAIKACRDERWIAVINPAFGNMVFQLVITPGSFKNWRAFIAQIENYKVEPAWVQTRFQFEDKQNGVLTFTMINWTPPEALAVIDAALAEKRTDAIVGRLDQPRTMALPAPQGAGGGMIAPSTPLPPNQFVPAGGTVGYVPPGPTTGQPPMQSGLPSMAPQQEIIPPGAPQAPFGQGGQAGAGAAPAAPTAPFGAPQAPAGNAGFAPPSNPAPAPAQQPTQRRRRNSAAAAAPAQNAAPAAPQGGFQPSAPPQQVQAPFGHAQSATAPQMQPAGQPAPQGGFPSTAAPAGASPSNNFGIAAGASVDPGMSQMLANLFPNQGQAPRQ